MKLIKGLTLAKKSILCFGLVVILQIAIALISYSSLKAAGASSTSSILTLSLIAIVVLVLSAFLLTRGIIRMLGGDPAAVMEIAGHVTKGNLMITVPDNGEPKDSLYTGLRMTVGGLGQRAAQIQEVADGNLNVHVNMHMKEDLIGLAVKSLVSNLNETMEQIQIVGDEITERSQDVASSSQSLSQGATESASSLEEISASLEELTTQTRSNAENAKQANALASEARDAATTGNSQMGSMVKAMAEINEASQNISKIIKTIDEIAFQTNLLALNAAVEAARAGQHGKGFAVVAEEVRNLAARSAKAAEETSDLIEGTVAKTANGSAIANQTAEALTEIVSGISKVTDLVSEISAASSEQAMGVDQISQGLNQIDQVTQRNTATAEESAAAAEMLSNQSNHLNQMLRRFTLIGGNTKEIALGSDFETFME